MLGSVGSASGVEVLREIPATWGFMGLIVSFIYDVRLSTYEHLFRSANKLSVQWMGTEELAVLSLHSCANNCPRVWVTREIKVQNAEEQLRRRNKSKCKTTTSEINKMQ